MARKLIICADWSKRPGHRAAWAADIGQRRVWRFCPPPFSFGDLAQAVRADVVRGGRILLAIDAPIGVPRAYLCAATKKFPGTRNDFISWLPRACASTEFFSATNSAEGWTVCRPFFNVPRGKGGLKSYIEAAGREKLYRKIDVQTGAKSVFAMRLPGQVSPAAQSLWRELVSARQGGLSFRVWPFEGTLGALLRAPGLTIAEIYPRAAYGTALSPVLPAKPVALAKTQASVRRKRITELERSEWVKRLRVNFRDMPFARASEDEFDACFTASAILRLVLEKAPLFSRADRVSEGAILCA